MKVEANNDEPTEHKPRLCSDVCCESYTTEFGHCCPPLDRAGGNAISRMQEGNMPVTGLVLWAFRAVSIGSNTGNAKVPARGCRPHSRASAHVF